MKSRRLIQIVPSLAPVVDGIGDYALQLARTLRDTQGVETSFLVCDPKWPRQRWSGEFEAVGLARHSASLLWGAMHLLALRSGENGSPILLHFSPYGYQKRGCPLWLVNALAALAKKSNARINVAFHELDVSRTKPWSSTYWVPGVQRRLLRTLLQLSRFSYTNTGLHQARLEAWGSRPVTLIPNFSNISELPLAADGLKRSREVIVFGRADQRRWTYERGSAALGRLCAHIGAARIVDIGSTVPGDVVDSIDGIPVDRRGVLPGNEVALAMNGALASFMYYPIPLLTKSGVHALSCASGTVAFVASDDPTASCKTLTKGIDYFPVSKDSQLPSLDVLERAAPLIAESYRKRSAMVAARTIAEELYDCGSSNEEPFTAENVQEVIVSPRDGRDELAALAGGLTGQEAGL